MDPFRFGERHPFQAIVLVNGPVAVLANQTHTDVGAVVAIMCAAVSVVILVVGAVRWLRSYGSG